MTRRSGNKAWRGWAAGVAGAAVAAGAAAADASTNAWQRFSLSRSATNDVEVSADQMQADRQSAWMEAWGHVVVRRGDNEMRADYARVNMRTHDADAVGNVVFTQSNVVWKSHEMHVNLRTGVGRGTDVAGVMDPLRVLRSESANCSTGGVYRLRRAVVTTCTNEYPRCHYVVRASRMEVGTGDYVEGKHAVWYLGGVPAIYLPYWYRSLDEDVGFRFTVGHSSRQGTFLLTTTSYRLNPRLLASTHVDIRTRRGLGLGQDLEWKGTNNVWYGGLKTYYINDQKPEAGVGGAADLDPNRYRVKFDHTHNYTSRDYLLARLQYVSDTNFLADFFEKEFKESGQPENYVSYTHRADKYTAGVLVQGRLNDCFSNVNRLPEAYVDFSRQEIGGSSFYYEGRTALCYLEKVFPASQTSSEDYAALRFDTLNTLYWSKKYFGFLNVMPRAGYRGTFYSETLEPTTYVKTVTNFVVSGGVTNTVVGTTNAVKYVASGADTRSRMELGLECSFKAFRTWRGPAGRTYRHVVEPYLNYTFVPEPTLMPEELRQFDSVDNLRDEHNVKVGCRNKWQVKRKKKSADIFDVDVYATCPLGSDTGGNIVSNVVLDAEIEPIDDLSLDIEATYNADESELDKASVKGSWTPSGDWGASAEYRYTRSDKSSELTATVDLFKKRPWSLSLSGRFDLEEDRVEEAWLYVQRTYDCMAIRLGAGTIPSYTTTDGVLRDDEYRFTLEFWLTAFPSTRLKAKHNE